MSDLPFVAWGDTAEVRGRTPPTPSAGTLPDPGWRPRRRVPSPRGSFPVLSLETGRRLPLRLRAGERRGGRGGRGAEEPGGAGGTREPSAAGRRRREAASVSRNRLEFFRQRYLRREGEPRAAGPPSGPPLRS